MRTYSLWLAERGAKLGILEQLNGSLTLMAAFERAILLPGLGFLSIGVVLLWALSPVGGQSALRVLKRGNLSSSNTTTVYYFNTTGDEFNGALQGADAFAFYKSSLNAILQASLTSIELVRGSDIWGNIKIPVLQYVPSYAAGQRKDDWYDFDEDSYDSPYSAFTGIIVSGLKDRVETNFTMESSYFNLTCTEPSFFNLSDGMTNAYNNSWGEFGAWVGTLSQRGQNSSQLFNEAHLSQNWDSYMLGTNYDHEPYTDVEPVYNIIYASLRETYIAAYNFTVRVFHVETEVVCTGSDCHVKRLRPSQNATWSNSGWPWPVESVTATANLLHWLETAAGQDRSASISPIDFYMLGYDYPYISEPFHDTALDYRNVSGPNLAARLQSLVNTGWQLSVQISATAQKPSENETALILSTNASSANIDHGGVGYPTIATTATTIERHDVFVCNMTWVIVTMIVSSVLLFCAIAGLIFKYDSNSPDILGFVSSMTRDNSNFEQILGGDKLDGLQRAKALRHLKVQIVDVMPEDPSGHITLRTLGPSGTAE